jgi:hypothetical protein
MDEKKDIHELLKKRIENLSKKNQINNKSLTPYRIAKNGELSVGTLNNFLNGTFKDARLSTIVKICAGLDVSIREFFDDDLFDK